MFKIKEYDVGQISFSEWLFYTDNSPRDLDIGFEPFVKDYETAVVLTLHQIEPGCRLKVLKEYEEEYRIKEHTGFYFEMQNYSRIYMNKNGRFYYPKESDKRYCKFKKLPRKQKKTLKHAMIKQMQKFDFEHTTSLLMDRIRQRGIVIPSLECRALRIAYKMGSGHVCELKKQIQDCVLWEMRYRLKNWSL